MSGEVVVTILGNQGYEKLILHSMFLRPDLEFGILNYEWLDWNNNLRESR